MAWHPEYPTDDHLLINAPGVIRANWEAIELGTDSALLITNAKIAPDADISDSKLHQITTAEKVSGAALILLANIPAAAGIIPVTNLPVGTSANKIVQLTAAAKLPAVDASLVTGLTFPQIAGTLATSKGGTGSTANANAANGVVVLDASGRLPAVSGSLLTNLPLGRQLFTSNGTFTVPAGITRMYVTGCGGGGGGGGGSGTARFASGGGGAGAAFCYRIPLTVVPETGYSIVVGAGGAGGAAGTPGSNGTTGNNTTIANAGTTLTLVGGDYGEASYDTGGIGGTGVGVSKDAAGGRTGGGIEVIDGGDGSAGSIGNQLYGGGGGGTLAGKGGTGGNGQATPGAAGTGYGSGGGGGGGDNPTASAGGAGASGFVLIEW